MIRRRPHVVGTRAAGLPWRRRYRTYCQTCGAVSPWLPKREAALRIAVTHEIESANVSTLRVVRRSA